MRRLLAKDPEDRPSAHQMLSHPWLRAVRSRAKVTTKNTHVRRPQLTEVDWAAPASASIAVGDGEEDQHRSPPRRRRPAMGNGAAVAAAKANAVASVTGRDPLSA